MVRYRSGHNGGASKASCPERGPWVRIPPSPPIILKSEQEIVLILWHILKTKFLEMVEPLRDSNRINYENF